MLKDFRPRRSVLYVPGNNARALDKARTLPCDALILDLEDAVAPDAKEAARAAVSEAVRSGAYGTRELIVRVNGLDSPWGEADLRAMVMLRPDGVLLPKVNHGADMLRAEAVLPNDIPLWAMIETAKGVLNAREIAACVPQMAGLVLGLNDLSKDLRVEQTPDRMALIYALSACVLAARAAGLVVLDGVYPNIKDLDGLVVQCAQGRALGFDGKTLIHPASIEIANKAFSPSIEAVEKARAIVAAWQTSGSAGVTTLDGELIEALHVQQAQELLAIDQKIREQG